MEINSYIFSFRIASPHVSTFGDFHSVRSFYRRQDTTCNFSRIKRPWQRKYLLRRRNISVWGDAKDQNHCSSRMLSIFSKRHIFPLNMLNVAWFCCQSFCSCVALPLRKYGVRFKWWETNTVRSSVLQRSSVVVVVFHPMFELLILSEMLLLKVLILTKSN